MISGSGVAGHHAFEDHHDSPIEIAGRKRTLSQKFRDWIAGRSKQYHPWKRPAGSGKSLVDAVRNLYFDAPPGSLLIQVAPDVTYTGIPGYRLIDESRPDKDVFRLTGSLTASYLMTKEASGIWMGFLKVNGILQDGLFAITAPILSSSADRLVLARNYASKADQRTEYFHILILDLTSRNAIQSKTAFLALTFESLHNSTLEFYDCDGKHARNRRSIVVNDETFIKAHFELAMPKGIAS